MITSLDLIMPDVPSPADILLAIRRGFISLAAGLSDQPAQTNVILPDKKGDCIFYPAYVDSVKAFGVKVSPYLVSRINQGLSPVTSYTLIICAETGRPLMLIDAIQLTIERTAATTILAIQELTKTKSPLTIGIIGSGPIGRGHARYGRLAFPSAKISIYSPSSILQGVKGDQRRALIQTECLGVHVATSIEDATSCDIIMLCTSSGTPVIDISKTQPDCIITSVGTNLPETHEIDWRLLNQLKVFCDFRQTCFRTAGDMKIAIKNKIWNEHSILGDIPELLNNKCSWDGKGRCYFRATGLALEDIVIAVLSRK